jgi:hypothetical protein
MSAFRRGRAIRQIPFFYFARTRLHGSRDIAFLAVTNWLLPLWLAIRLSGLGAAECLTAFLGGYLAFISIYEIGYVANDCWDARRTDSGRRRDPLGFSAPEVVLFMAIRLATFTAIAGATGWWRRPDWAAGYAALVIALLLHNLTGSSRLRLPTFLSLAVLRFTLPVIALVPPPGRPSLLMAAVLLYALPRLLAYAVSKGLVTRPAEPFALRVTALLGPITLWLAWALPSRPLLEVYAILLAAHVGWRILAAADGRDRGSSNPRAPHRSARHIARRSNKG